MPIPSNITFGTAIDITSFPYSNTQAVFDSGTNITYDVWYSVTVPAGIYAFSAWAYGGVLNSGYQPLIYMFEDSGGSPSDYPAANQVRGLSNRPVQFGVTPGQKYWFKIIWNGNVNPGVNPSNLTFNVQTHTDLAIPTGSFLIIDDTKDYPSVFISSINADNDNVLRIIQPGYGHGEGGDVLATSHNMLLTDHPNGQMFLYDDAFTLLNTIVFGPGTGGQRVLIRSNQATQKFWAAQRNYSNPPVLNKYDLNGNLEVTTTLSASGLQAFAPSADDLDIYVAGNPTLATSNIKKWNIAGASFSNLVAAIAGYQIRDMLVTGGEIFALYTKVASPGDIYVKRYDNVGALISTYAFETAITIPSISFGYRLAFAMDDPNSFWVWYHKSDGSSNPGISIFKNVKISDGSVLATIQYTEYEIGQYTLAQTATPVRFGISNSCPFFVYRGGEVPPPVGTATLIIQKQTVPSPDTTDTSFPFDATAPLTPPSFTLQDGDTQTYSDLDPGTYGVTETVPAGWAVTYSVSNGSPHDAIVIAEGETVTVIVTNTRVGPPGPNPIVPTNANSGIYRIVPDKRNDTLWDSYSPKRTKDKKIPDPFVQTGLIGK